MFDWIGVLHRVKTAEKIGSKPAWVNCTVVLSHNLELLHWPALLISTFSTSRNGLYVVYAALKYVDFRLTITRHQQTNLEVSKPLASFATIAVKTDGCVHNKS
jgi:hypothetical protein